MHAWLLDRYWLFAGLIVIWSTPLVAFAGGLADVLGVSVFGALSVAGWIGARWSRGVAVRVHLAALVLGWAWYSSLADGLPARVDRGGAAFGAMIMLPVLVSVAIDGPRGASTMGTLALLSALARFGFALDAAIAAFLVGMGVIVGLTFHRQTETMKRANDRLVRIATHDVITDLPTRRVLQERLDHVERGALLVIGIRRFKTVNDVYGHAAGDALLRLVGARLRLEAGAMTLTKSDRAPFLAYLGSDSFGLVLPEAEEAGALAVARQMLAALEVPFEHMSRSIQIGGRVGVVVWPAEGVTPSTLLSCGDRAAARARQSPEHLVAFDPSLDREADRTLEVELTRALEQRELVPFYQAVCDLSSGEMVGLEALVRWNHPSRGVLSPFAFVECAEMTGQIVHVDRYMLRAVAAQLQDWRRHGLMAWVAVNVSARTVDDPAFLDFVRELLAERPDLRGSIVLEVTESTAMRDPERATRTLQAMRELGVRIALDDFGMGHSSLAYLKRFPADHLKLDRLFVSGIGSSARDEALLEILLGLAKQFGMEVIAEGIETPDQLRWLTARGCGFAQGFLFSKPMPAAEIPVVRSRVSGVYATEVRGSAPSLDDAGAGI